MKQEQNPKVKLVLRHNTVASTVASFATESEFAENDAWRQSRLNTPIPNMIFEAELTDAAYERVVVKGRKCSEVFLLKDGRFGLISEHTEMTAKGNTLIAFEEAGETYVWLRESGWQVLVDGSGLVNPQNLPPHVIAEFDAADAVRLPDGTMIG